jgi:hypothetical protein
MSARRPLVLAAFVLAGGASCAGPGENACVDVPPPRAPTPRQEVERLVGDLLSSDERRSREAQATLRSLDGERRRALEAHARAVPSERDPRWLAALDENGLLRDATPAERLDLLLWKASREGPGAAEARAALLEAARGDPTPLLERLGREGPGRDALATALGEARVERAVPPLLALYRGPKTPAERKAASAALGAIAGDALRPRVEGTDEEREADAARVEEWYATRRPADAR